MHAQSDGSKMEEECLLCGVRSQNSDLFAQYILRNDRRQYRETLCRKHTLQIKLAGW